MATSEHRALFAEGNRIENWVPVQEGFNNRTAYGDNVRPLGWRVCDDVLDGLTGGCPIVFQVDPDGVEGKQPDWKTNYGGIWHLMSMRLSQPWDFIQWSWSFMATTLREAALNDPNAPIGVPLLIAETNARDKGEYHYDKATWKRLHSEGTRLRHTTPDDPNGYLCHMGAIVCTPKEQFTKDQFTPQILQDFVHSYIGYRVARRGGQLRLSPVKARQQIVTMVEETFARNIALVSFLGEKSARCGIT